MHVEATRKLDRFELLSQAGSGGMGTVYRARDEQSGAIVALKVLRDPQRGDADRFQHEARILEELSHPHIVRCAGHGKSASGEPYIVMEWLEGETLDERLGRGPLSVEDTLELARRAADALAAAHARAILHRDIKPSNIFLVDKDVRRLKILDFGIARIGGATRNLTRTGSILGTPGYMAPEQARGELALGPAVDVFALGCVLFECLAGKPAFQGVHPMALLAKLLMDEPPRLSEVRPDAPRALARLVDRMLAKSPSARPQDGAAVAEALASKDESDRAAMPSSHGSSLIPAISTTERRLVSIVAIAPLAGALPDDASLEATLEAAGERARALLADIRTAGNPLGASADVLADGTILVVLSGNGEHPTEQAGRAARCALWTREIAPRLAMALVTGRGEATGRSPVGALLERAAELISRAPREEARGPRGVVLVDEATRALLDARFEVFEEHGAAVLRGEKPIGDQPRTLLGKPTPFVGRERELRRILEIVEDTFEEKIPTALLIEAEAGAGKSRLRQELLARLREQWEGAIVVVGRGDAMSAGSAFATLGSLFRGALGIEEGEPALKQREKVSFLVNLFVAPEDQRRVTEFMGELVRVPFPDEESPKLRAARQSPQIMADQIEAAYLDFARACAAARPIVIILEDLHWGDVASVRLVDAALRDLQEPYMVIAFARPEVHERFPRLWAGRRVHPIRLGPLPRRAAEQLSRSALGDDADPAKINAIVERAGGNAFFLEELLRAVASGYGDALPETVLGMLETRLSALPAEARWLLRAASVLGEIFWKNGMKTLLGAEGLEPWVSDTLRALVDQEILIVRRERRFSGEDEYAFRHGLLREAAYAMLTERDRQAGHLSAGEWLERVGEQDPRVLATHFDRGGQGERAAIHYRRAAEQALRGSDYGSAIQLAERGIALCTEHDLLAELFAARAFAAFWTADYELATRAAKEALARSRRGSRSDCRALGHAVAAGVFRQGSAALDEHLDRLLQTEPMPDAIGVVAQAFSSAMMALMSEAPRERATRFLRRLEEIAAPSAPGDPTVAAWLEYVRGTWARNVENDAWAALAHDEAAAESFELAGDRAFLPYVRTFVGLDWALLGDFDRAQAEIGRACAKARPGSVQANLAHHFSAFVLLEQGQLAEARARAVEVAAAATARNDELVFFLASILSAEADFEAGEVAAADAATAALATKPNRLPYQGMWLLTLRARIRLRLRDPLFALSYADEALLVAQRLGRGYFARHPTLLLTRAEALFELGRMEDAKRAIESARDHVAARAARIDAPKVREVFFKNIPAHARIISLADSWLDPAYG